MKLSKIDKLKMFAESLGLNPDEVLAKDALAMPHRIAKAAQECMIKGYMRLLRNS